MAAIYPLRYLIHAHDAVQAMGIFVGAFPIYTGPLAVQVVNRYKNGGVGTYCVQTRGFNRARRPLVGIFAKLTEPITATFISLNTQPNCRTCAKGYGNTDRDLLSLRGEWHSRPE